MAPPARKARAEMSLGRKPRCGSATAALRSVAVRMVDVTGLVVLAVVYTVHNVVVGGALCSRRCKTRRMSAATGQVVE